VLLGWIEVWRGSVAGNEIGELKVIAAVERQRLDLLSGNDTSEVELVVSTPCSPQPLISTVV
jgi:hypothetical protein